MYELINRASQWVLETSGIRNQQYTFETRKRDQNGAIATYLEMYKFDTPTSTTYVETVGPFFSDFAMGLSIGNKRLWGRLEYIIGRGIGLAGIGLWIGAVSPILDSRAVLNWEQVIISGCAVGLGYVVGNRGQQRKDIASTIINTLGNK